MKSNLAIRLLTAAVVVPPLLGLLFKGPAWGFFALVLVASAVAADELFRMTHPNDAVARAVGIAQTAAACFVTYWFSGDARALLAMIAGITLVGLLMPLWRLGDMQTAALRMLAGVAGPFYVGSLLATLALLRRDGGDTHGGWLVFMSFTFSWLADTGGYFFGRFLGKTKLYEAVSPKKTRAGFVGALVGASVGAALASLLYLPALPLAHALPLGLFAGSVGQLGDLVESLLKRSTGIKDSGGIVPGHGGMLDRIDALIVVSPIVYLYSSFSGLIH
ncbi:MAG TPA: phosphatidate cytidylyltransferase [Polyangiaceae bacterium]|nr:phosphatidate cytidylyltransferase [Polyangiaceae bacterium]